MRFQHKSISSDYLTFYIQYGANFWAARKGVGDTTRKYCGGNGINGLFYHVFCCTLHNKPHPEVIPGNCIQLTVDPTHVNITCLNAFWLPWNYLKLLDRPTLRSIATFKSLVKCSN